MSITSKAAFTFENGDYGVPIEIASGDQLHLVSESVRARTNVNQTRHLFAGRRASAFQNHQLRTVEGSITLEAYYDDMNLIAACLGISNRSFSPGSLGSGYVHTLYMDDDMGDRAPTSDDGSGGDMIRRGTLAIEKEVAIWQHVSAMVRSLNLVATPTTVQITFGILGQALGLDQSPNTDSSGWSFINDDQNDRVTFDECEVFMATVGGTIDDSGNRLCASAIGLNVSNGLGVAQDRNFGIESAPPYTKSPPVVSGTIRMPRYESGHASQLVFWATQGTKVEVLYRFTGRSFGGGNFGWDIYIPEATIVSAGADTKGAAATPQDFAFIADRSPSVNPPREITWTITNRKSNNPFE